jgi:hypothetical protein
MLIKTILIVSLATFSLAIPVPGDARAFCLSQYISLVGLLLCS